MHDSSSTISGRAQPEKTAAEKIEAFDRIAAILAEQRELERYQQQQRDWEGVRLSRNDAYRAILQWVTGEKVI